ncbi:hypothetical protein C9I92_06665 [Photobacterium ganghwense]|uniref:NAD(P)-binding domain-containing protein n=1 Tax=Photobacterium ganghwense TaxID=320778 RepID=A0A0J1HE65_9GAMM|nr:hypothetical protein [Photobacterium ganghwense]KLV09908.1 hypothetical protein ABT57_09550 [Photobacterium ganghwense]PSU09245.1 hypothetical protein C9I92_06665 [Photobacterium ganghwense]QSV16435.1 hypothetical protein FH974_24875 [Photobacterium ganghwense]
MKKALVLGAEQQMGNLLCQALNKHHWDVVAAISDHTQPVFLSDNLMIAEMAPDDHALMEQLVSESETVFLHLPDPCAGPLCSFSLDTLIELVARYQRHLVLTTNHYDIHHSMGNWLWQRKAPLPLHLPASLTARIQQAVATGASVSVVCFGYSLDDQFQRSFLGMLIKETSQKLILQSPSPYELCHYWTFLPDLAENLVHRLTEQPCQPTGLDVFFYRGYKANMQDIARCLALSSGKPVSVMPLHWPLFGLLALFSPLFRGFTKMRRFWQQGGQLAITGKLRGHPAMTHTPLELAMQHCWNKRRRPA